MGRPHKIGLDYFPLDVRLRDRERFIEAKHGNIGFAILVKIWMKIYRDEGYYCKFDEKTRILFARDEGVEPMTVEHIVGTCLNEGVFDKAIYEKEMILTSRAVQRRYTKICQLGKRVEIRILKRYLKLEPDDIIDIGEKLNIVPLDQEDTGNNSGVKPIESAVKPEETPQSKVKKTVKLKKKESGSKKTPAVYNKFKNFDTLPLSVLIELQRDKEFKKIHVFNEYDKFIDSCFDKGKKSKNYLSKFKNWLRKEFAQKLEFDLHEKELFCVTCYGTFITWSTDKTIYKCPEDDTELLINEIAKMRMIAFYDMLDDENNSIPENDHKKEDKQ